MPDNPIVVRVPQVNVNDEQVRILSWQVESGQHVEKGQLVVEVETSKSAVEIEAAEDGYIHYTRHTDEDVAVGDILYFLTIEPSDAIPGGPPIVRPAAFDPIDVQILAPAEPAYAGGPLNPDGAAVDSAKGPTELAPNHTSPARFSSRARGLLEQQNLDAAAFAGRGLVRECDVRRLMDGDSIQPAAPAALRLVGASPQHRANGVPVRSQPLSRQKAIEAKLLAASYFSALASSVTIACSTQGLRRAVANEPSLRANATALIVFETARLLRQFPVFNAFCADSEICFYEQVNIGFAVDAGRGLKVLIVHQADRKSAEAIANEMHALVAAYLEDRLPAPVLTGGTFTLTDLSGEDIETFQPLLNQGQSAILGVGAERIGPGQSDGVFHLILTFDHRVAEGRVAGRFLSALRARLAAHELALTSASRSDQRWGAGSETTYCSRCMRTVEQLKPLNGYLVRSVFPDGLLCSICLTGF